MPIPKLQKEIDKRWVCYSFIAIVILYLVTISFQWWPTPDSSLYLGLGKSIAHGQGYQFNGETSNDVTPGFPAILAGIMTLFGENFLVFNLFIAACSLLTLWLMYTVLFQLTGDRRLILTVILCTALCYDYYRLSREVLTDVPFCLFFWLILYGTVRFRSGSWLWLIVLALLTIAGLTVRVPGVFILLSLATGLFIRWPGQPNHWPRRISLPAVLFVSSVGITGLFYYLSRIVTTHMPCYIAVNIKGQGYWGITVSILQKILDGGCELPKTLSDMVLSQGSTIFGIIPLVLLLAGCAVAWRNSLGFLGILCGLSLLGYAAVSGAFGVRVRYLLSLLPIFYLLMFWGGLWWWNKIATWSRKSLPTANATAYALAVVVVIFAGFHLPRILKIGLVNIAYSYRSDYYSHFRRGDFEELMTISSIFANDDSSLPIYAPKVSQLHYLSGKVIRLLPAETLKMGKEASVSRLYVFASDPEVYGYFVISLKHPLAKQITGKLDSDERFSAIYSGKTFAVYKKEK